jgi:phosphate transport system permease protein
MTASAIPLQRDSGGDGPRRIQSRPHPTDRVFRGVSRGVGALVLVLTGAIGLFLAVQLIPVVHHYGFKFFTTQQWNVDTNQVGVAAAIFGSVEVAVVALLVAFPLALSTALFITEYAPRRFKPLFVSAVDLMAAVPSIVYGLWGFYILQGMGLDVSRWFAEWFSFIPILKVDADPHSAPFLKPQFTESPFLAGLVVAMMVIPLACAVMRGVFDQAPAGEREAALALGSTRWGVVQSVVLPFGRGGIIGGTMLGLGRALGETVAVLIMLSQIAKINPHVLQNGGVTVSSLIADHFGDASRGVQLDALLAAGFVLFVMTLFVNTIAGIVVTRSRSGATTEI